MIVHAAQHGFNSVFPKSEKREKKKKKVSETCFKKNQLFLLLNDLFKNGLRMRRQI